MKKLEGVANTTYVPLIARIAVSKRFPEYFFDQAALDLEAKIPAGAEKGSYEYSNMASVARYYNLDDMISAFAEAHEACNVVLLGLGLETRHGRRRGGREGHGEGHRKRAGADAALLPTAEPDRRRGDAAPHGKGPDPDGTADLVGGDAHQVQTRGVEIQGHVPEGLHRVAVTPRARP